MMASTVSAILTNARATNVCMAECVLTKSVSSYVYVLLVTSGHFVRRMWTIVQLINHVWTERPALTGSTILVVVVSKDGLVSCNEFCRWVLQKLMAILWVRLLSLKQDIHVHTSGRGQNQINCLSPDARIPSICINIAEDVCTSKQGIVGSNPTRVAYGVFSQTHRKHSGSYIHVHRWKGKIKSIKIYINKQPQLNTVIFIINLYHYLIFN